MAGVDGQVFLQEFDPLFVAGLPKEGKYVTKDGFVDVYTLMRFAFEGIFVFPQIGKNILGKLVQVVSIGQTSESGNGSKDGRIIVVDVFFQLKLN